MVEITGADTNTISNKIGEIGNQPITEEVFYEPGVDPALQAFANDINQLNDEPIRTSVGWHDAEVERNRVRREQQIKHIRQTKRGRRGRRQR